MEHSGVWQGRVERIDGPRAWVSIPHLRTGHVYGPCLTMEMPGTPGLATSLSGFPAHAHGAVAAPLAVGDSVVVAFFEGVPDQPVVLGRVAT